MTIDALPAAYASALGLRVSDLAELGGISEKSAIALLKGQRAFPEDIIEAIELLNDDVEVMFDVMCDMEELTVFRTNRELREVFRAWPARGKSGGGFIGPHRCAVVAAHEETGAIVRFVD